MGHIVAIEATMAEQCIRFVQAGRSTVCEVRKTQTGFKHFISFLRDNLP